MSKQRNTTGIAAMRDEGYSLPIENEKKLQKTEFAWWSAPVVIIFLTVSMSVLDALVLYELMDQAMTLRHCADLKYDAASYCQVYTSGDVPTEERGSSLGSDRNCCILLAFFEYSLA